jgi:hypothetical protein
MLRWQFNVASLLIFFVGLASLPRSLPGANLELPQYPIFIATVGEPSLLAIA